MFSWKVGRTAPCTWQFLAIGIAVLATQTGCASQAVLQHMRAAESIQPVATPSDSAVAPAVASTVASTVTSAPASEPASTPTSALALVPTSASASVSGSIPVDTNAHPEVWNHQPVSFASVAASGVVVRWQDRVRRPVRIRVEEGRDVGGWSPNDRQLIEDAVAAWEKQGVPVQFVIVSAGDTASDADVVVHWVDQFSSGVCGWTTVTWDSARVIHHGNVQLALHTPDGRPLTREERRVLAIHEFGHVLGLGHSSDASSIMSSVIYATEIAQTDVASLQWLYRPSFASMP